MTAVGLSFKVRFFVHPLLYTSQSFSVHWALSLAPTPALVAYYFVFLRRQAWAKVIFFPLLDALYLYL